MTQQTHPFNGTPDIYVRIAAEIYNVPPDRVTAMQRWVAKEVSCAAASDVEPRALAAKLNISYEEARVSIERASQLMDEEVRRASNT